MRTYINLYDDKFNVLRLDFYQFRLFYYFPYARPRIHKLFTLAARDLLFFNYTKQARRPQFLRTLNAISRKK